MRLPWIRAAFLAGVMAAAMPAAASAQEVLSVPTRPGVTVRVLLVTPAGEPSATLLMFPGGFGNNHFPERDGRIVLSENFLVLTASLGDSGRGPSSAVTVYDAPLKRITVPVLVVHHQQDACRASSFGAATGLPAALSGSAKVDFVAVEGGDPPRSAPCEALAAHGYLGRERGVVGVIADWIAGKPVPKQLP